MILLKTLGQLAELVNGSVIGDASTVIEGVGSIAQGAGPGSITFIESGRLLEKAEKTMAAAVIVPGDVCSSIKPLLVAGNPRQAFAEISRLFVQKPLGTGQVHRLSFIHQSASIGQNVSVHPFAVISENAVVGDSCIIGPGAYIGKNVKLGSHCEIHANAVIEHDALLGDNVIIHGGTVIGADGFGFVTTEDRHCKMPQLGNVIIGDDVEIFANCTVDRGTIGPTVIGSGTKLGDHVHIGHNVELGPQCMIIAMTVLGGSAKLGRRVIVGGHSGIREHITIGDNVMLAAGSIALGNIKDNSFCSGHPAIDHNKDYRIRAAARRLPNLIKQVSALEKKVAELEKKLGQKE